MAAISCASYFLTLKALTDLRGVVEANVDLQIGTAVVTAIVEGVTLQPLSQAEEAGYRARVLICRMNKERMTIMAKDPVCGMEVDEKTATWTSEYQSKTYCFCAPGCKAAFDKDPERYLRSGSSGMPHHQSHHG